MELALTQYLSRMHGKSCKGSITKRVVDLIREGVFKADLVRRFNKEVTFPDDTGDCQSCVLLVLMNLKVPGPSISFLYQLVNRKRDFPSLFAYFSRIQKNAPSRASTALSK